MTDDTPPYLPRRCFTMMNALSPEDRAKASAAFREREDEYIAWVNAHPAPRPEWVATVRRIEEGRAMVDPSTTIGRVLQAFASAPSDRPNAAVIILGPHRKGG